MKGLRKDVRKVAAFRGWWKCSWERTNSTTSPNVIDGTNGGGGTALTPCGLCEHGFLVIDPPRVEILAMQWHAQRMPPCHCIALSCKGFHVGGEFHRPTVILGRQVVIVLWRWTVTGFFFGDKRERPRSIVFAGPGRRDFLDSSKNEFVCE